MASAFCITISLHVPTFCWSSACYRGLQTARLPHRTRRRSRFDLGFQPKLNQNMLGLCTSTQKMMIRKKSTEGAAVRNLWNSIRTLRIFGVCTVAFWVKHLLSPDSRLIPRKSNHFHDPEHTHCRKKFSTSVEPYFFFQPLNMGDRLQHWLRPMNI